MVPIPGLHRAALDALSSLPVRVLMTVGHETDPAELGAEDIVRLPDVVRAVLAHRTYREAAKRIAQETSRLPTVDAAAGLLEAYSQPRSVA